MTSMTASVPILSVVIPVYDEEAGGQHSAGDEGLDAQPATHFLAHQHEVGGGTAQPVGILGHGHGEPAQFGEPRPGVASLRGHEPAPARLEGQLRGDELPCAVAHHLLFDVQREVHNGRSLCEASL